MFVIIINSLPWCRTVLHHLSGVNIFIYLYINDFFQYLEYCSHTVLQQVLSAQNDLPPAMAATSGPEILHRQHVNS